jgi:PAS domain S-box-containing protein
MSEDAFDPAAFLDAAPLVPISLCPTSGRVTFVGPQACRYLGYPAEAWLAEDFWSRVIFPDDQASVARARAAAAPDRVHSIDYRMEHAEGRVVWISELMSLGPGPDGHPQLCGFLLDVTERKRQEVALWKSEEWLRAILRRAPDAMVLTDLDGIILNMNDQAEALFEYRPAEIAGSSIDHLFPDRLRERLDYLREAFERDPRRRSVVDGHSLVIERRDGTEIPVELSMSLVGTGSDPRQILCSVRDLTARRLAEARLRASERRLREMADVVPAMVSFVDERNRFRLVNTAFAEHFGWEREHVEGRHVREVLGPPLHERLQSAIQAALEGRRTTLEMRLAEGVENEVVSRVDVVPKTDEDGAVAGYFMVLSEASGQPRPPS